MSLQSEEIALEFDDIHSRVKKWDRSTESSVVLSTDYSSPVKLLAALRQKAVVIPHDVNCPALEFGADALDLLGPMRRPVRIYRKYLHYSHQGIPLTCLCSGKSGALDGTLKDFLKITQGSTRSDIAETEDIPIFDGGSDAGCFSTDTFCWNETRFDMNIDAAFPTGSLKSACAMTEGVWHYWQTSGQAGTGVVLDVRAGCLWTIFVDSTLGANYLYGRAALQYKFRKPFVFDAVLIPAGSKM